MSSRVVLFADGSTKTLELYATGKREFGTNQKEHMELLAGEWQVLLPDETQWQAMKAGDSFNVDANVTFRVKVTDFADYCCSYT